MKLSVLQRKFVFWGVCIPLRAYLSSMGDSEYLRVFGAYIGSRWLLGAESGTIGAFGGKAWWAEERGGWRVRCKVEIRKQDEDRDDHRGSQCCLLL